MFNVRRLITQVNLRKTNQILQNLTTKASEGKNFVLISNSCVKRLKELKSAEESKYLRVLVDSGGCSGLEYKFSLDSNITKDDLFIEKDGCQILVDKESLEYIKGSTIDYYEELIRSGFRVIDNPNSEQGCSCGSSFSIKI